jgi:putative membrane protein
MMHYGWTPWHTGGGFGGMWIGPIFLIVILAAAVWAASAILSRGDGGRPLSHNDKTPREILDERFARGEIDEEEYRRRRDLLNS